MFKHHEFAQSFIKLIVEKKTDTDKFERFISVLYAAGVHEIKVIEDPSFEQDLNEEIDIEKEDTLTILERYLMTWNIQIKMHSRIFSSHCMLRLWS